MSYVSDHMYLDLVSLVLFLCTVIPVWVIIFLGLQVWSFKGIISISPESDLLEFIWTLVPSLIVVLLCTFNVQYIMSSDSPDMAGCVKVVGRQWYWSYETIGDPEYDSMMTDLLSGVDKPLRLFYRSPCNLLVTSADVIHSFSVPDLGIKIDAVPGRINQGDLFPDRMGVFAGYCTELCGAGHAYMPVVIEVVKRANYF